MSGVPKKWLAVVLGLFSPVLAMLYVAQGVLAAVYFVAVVGAALLAFTMVHSHPIASLVLMYGLNIVGMVHAYFLARAYPAERPWNQRGQHRIVFRGLWQTKEKSKLPLLALSAGLKLEDWEVWK